VSNTRPKHPTKPKHATIKRGRTIKTFELTNIAKPVSHKMKPLSSRAVVHKKRGTHKTPKVKRTTKVVSTPTTRSIARAKVALARAARAPRGHKHERKPRTARFTNIEKTPTKSNRGPTEPKISKKGWYS
jgi:hypothetical protein